MKPGGIREPHWHPSAWELNFVVSGGIRWSLAGPNGTHDAFEGGACDLVFAPQGHFHYFKNASATEELVVLIAFNASASEPEDDIGVVAAVGGLPADVLGAVFGAPPEVFAKLPHLTATMPRLSPASARWRFGYHGPGSAAGIADEGDV